MNAANSYCMKEIYTCNSHAPAFNLKKCKPLLKGFVQIVEFNSLYSDCALELKMFYCLLFRFPLLFQFFEATNQSFLLVLNGFVKNRNQFRIVHHLHLLTIFCSPVI